MDVAGEEESKMANKKTGDKSALNIIVLWCLCVFAMIVCGYSLYRQHKLEQRVLVLETWQQELVKVKAVSQEKPKSLRRETRDANDCICPPGKW